jgi:mRNA-degrading endonuclease toxin of MazEF toxin-antitoxin module
MQSSGDVVELDLGRPEGREAGSLHPAVVITAQRGPLALSQIRETIAVIIDLP